ncbi:hypothetical protein MMC21_006043 [Puttea exsequens]|nr:hypothetical protein [Puttea exsequens]
MAKATNPDRHPADAAAAASSARGMHDSVGAEAATAHDDAGEQKSPRASLPTQQKRKTKDAESEITRRDVHTASSVHAQQRRRLPSQPLANKEPTLAQQASLNRTKGHEQPPSSGPVLVRKPSQKRDDMRKKPPTTTSPRGSPVPPPLGDFSFSDILASLGPDADASIDAIAEICGKSKMSLAEEHSSHLPPQGNMSIQVRREASPAESVPPLRLETVEETGPRTRARTRRLVREGGAGDATAAVVKATSVGQNAGSATGGPRERETAGQGQLVSQVMSWLQWRGVGDEAPQNDNAVRVLYNILHDTASVHS